MKTSKPNCVDRIVQQLDETRHAEHWRNPDRPDGKFVPSRGRQDPEVVRAKTRIRTAHWRNRLDQRGAPTAYQIGMSMVFALVTARMEELTEADRGIVGRMLTDMQSRGFSVIETRNTLRRLRNKLADPADREG